MDNSAQETIYEPRPDMMSPRRMLRGIFDGFWNGRELAWRLFVRQLRGMYRQTLLGMFWIFLPPIANTAIWVFLRSRNVFDFGDDPSSPLAGLNTTAYILTGMILWQSFVDALQMPMDTVSSNRGMVTKLNFPREALILQGLGDLSFNLAIRMLLLVPTFIFFGVSLHWGVLAAIPVILLMLLFAVGLGLILLPFGSLYHDVGRFIGIAIPFWMIITPIIYYLPNTSPGNLLNWLNPASPLLVASRDLLLMGTTEHVAASVVFGLIAIPTFIVGLIVYRIAIPALIERMAN
ncbi:MAG: ABC transporter permease [Pirellulaceae bacterium]